MNKDLRYPLYSSFPQMLTFKAEDADGNERDVVYFNANTCMSIIGRVGELMSLAEKPKLDFGERKDGEEE